MIAGKYLLKISGCQMSFHDAEAIAGQLQHAGYAPTNNELEADVIIFQTCCVRETAERKIYGQINQLQALKRNKPDLIIGMTGCLAQKDQDKVLKLCPHIDFVLGTKRLGELEAILANLSLNRHPIVDVAEEGTLENLPQARTDGVRAYINITYGCNNFCSYCIVPYVRGPEMSREPNAVVAEVKDALASGYKEIMLLGQNVNTYGRDLGGRADFVSLLKTIDNLPGLARTRYMTSHPRDFTQDMILTVKNSRTVCEHFHLPIQSGSNRILKLMNRGYTREHYLELVDNIRTHIPHSSITTDLIVGFPGETEEDFAATLDLVEKVRFDAAYTFIFSPRKGTKAATLPEQIPSNVKKERLSCLNTIQSRISRDINLPLIGQKLEVLVEGPSKNNPDILSGRTRTNKLVHFSGPRDLVGHLVLVTIKRAFTWTLHGELVSD
ncbi:MAG: tRNA (N6-isopentenyl adenosine(37)-C2)-methylthiotransferase MiaB [Firmicutes bacterium]|nr:tRNA (N6-isopentenyl adenosine(37)-C2)-methylthiotransferase MiaB [Bacillota bacterium]